MKPPSLACTLPSFDNIRDALTRNNSWILLFSVVETQPFACCTTSKNFWKNSQNHRETPVPESPFNNAEDVKLASFTSRLNEGCFHRCYELYEIFNTDFLILQNTFRQTFSNDSLEKAYTNVFSFTIFRTCH